MIYLTVMYRDKQIHYLQSSETQEYENCIYMNWCDLDHTSNRTFKIVGNKGPGDCY